MLRWIRALIDRRRRPARDPADTVARELRNAEARRDIDSLATRVREDEEHRGTPLGGGVVGPPI